MVFETIIVGMGNSRVESVVRVGFSTVSKVSRALCFLSYVSCALSNAMIDARSLETG